MPEYLGLSRFDDDAEPAFGGFDEYDPSLDHDNHDERYVGGCRECDEELGMEMQAHRPHPNSMSYPEAEEGLAMRRRLPENQ